MRTSNRLLKNYAFGRYAALLGFIYLSHMLWVFKSRTLYLRANGLFF